MIVSVERRNRQAVPGGKARTSGRVALLLVACHALVAGGCKAHHEDVLRVGVTPGPAEDILHSVEPELAR